MRSGAKQLTAEAGMIGSLDESMIKHFAINYFQIKLGSLDELLEFKKFKFACFD